MREAASGTPCAGKPLRLALAEGAYAPGAVVLLTEGSKPYFQLQEPTMNRIQFTSLACALAATFALSGCGKAGDGTTGSTGSTTGTSPSTTTSPMAPASAASR